jgi:hypothetical protein
MKPDLVCDLGPMDRSRYGLASPSKHQVLRIPSKGKLTPVYLPFARTRAICADAGKAAILAYQG